MDYAKAKKQILDLVIQRSIEPLADESNEILRVQYDVETPRLYDKWYFWTVTTRVDYFNASEFREALYRHFRITGIKHCVWGYIEEYPSNTPVKKGLHFHGVTMCGTPPKQDSKSNWRVNVDSIKLFNEKNALDLTNMGNVWNYIIKDLNYTKCALTRRFFNRLNICDPNFGKERKDFYTSQAEQES